MKFLFSFIFTVVRKSIPENSQKSQKEIHLNVRTNSPHDPQAWADDEVDEEFVGLDAQEVLGTWEDLLAALQPPVQSVTTAAPVPEVAASEEVSTESEAHETIEAPSVAVDREVSGDTAEVDAAPKARAPDEAIEVEHTAEAAVTMWSQASAAVEEVTTVMSQDFPEVHKPSDNTVGLELAEVCEVEDTAAVACEVSGEVPASFAQQVTAIAVQEKSLESEEAVGPFPCEASEEAPAPSDLLALASCET